MNKVTANRKWAWVVIAALLAVLVAACSGSTADTSNSSTAGGEQSNSSSGGDNKQEPAPVVEVKEEPVELHIVSRKLGTANEDNMILHELENRLNLKLNWEKKPPADYQQTSQVILASGDYPDVMEVWWANAEQEITNFAEDGVLAELSGLLSQYGQHILEHRPFQETWLHPFGDERVFVIPSRFNEYGVDEVYTVRQDWLDNLGLSMPTTLDEFYEVARAFTFDDPDGNGLNDTVGVGVGKNGAAGIFHGSPFQMIMGAFGVLYGWNEVDGQLLLYPVMPEMLDALKYYRTLYQDGLVEPEFPIITRERYLENKNQNKYGIESWWPTHLDPGDSAWYRTFKENVPEAELSFLPPFVEADGQQRFLGGGLKSYAPSIAIFTKDPVKQQKAIELVNYLASDEGAELVAFGLEGQHWDDENGKIKVRSLSDEEMNNSGAQLYSWFFRQKVYMRNASDLVFEALNTYKDHVVRPIELPVTPAQTNYMQGLNDLTNNRFMKIVVEANVNPDAEFAQFVDEWYKSGGQELIDQANAAYAAMK